MSISELIKQGQDKSAMLTRSLKHQVELYAEKTHFVYELLQNAEDADATQVAFINLAIGLKCCIMANRLQNLTSKVFVMPLIPTKKMIAGK